MEDSSNKQSIVTASATREPALSSGNKTTGQNTKTIFNGKSITRHQRFTEAKSSTRKTALPDDPLNRRGQLCTLSKGATVFILNQPGSLYYVETTVKGKPIVVISKARM